MLDLLFSLFECWANKFSNRWFLQVTSLTALRSTFSSNQKLGWFFFSICLRPNSEKTPLFLFFYSSIFYAITCVRWSCFWCIQYIWVWSTWKNLSSNVFIADFKQVNVCSANIYLFKSTIETLRKVWNMFKGNNKNIRTTSMMSFWCFYWKLWTYFTPFSSVSIVEFEQVNVNWEVSYNDRNTIHPKYWNIITINWLLP